MNRNLLCERVGGTFLFPSKQFPKILSEGFEIKEIALILVLVYVVKSLASVAVSQAFFSDSFPLGLFYLGFFVGAVSRSTLPVFVAWTLIHTGLKWGWWSFIAHKLSQTLFKGAGEYSQVLTLFGYARLAEVVAILGLVITIIWSSFSTVSLFFAGATLVAALYLRMRALEHAHGLEPLQSLCVVVLSGICMWIPVFAIDSVIIGVLWWTGVI